MPSYRIKITAPEWATYTGFLGQVEFENAVSTEVVSERNADRVACSIPCVYIDEDGKEVGDCGPANRLVGGATLSFEPAATLPRQSDKDKADEAKAAELAKATKAPTEFNTVEELKEIADKGGIKALRTVGDAWGVRGRAIPELIGDILKAQSEFKARIDAAKEAEAKPAEGVTHESEAEHVEPVVDAEPETLEEAEAAEEAKAAEEEKSAVTEDETDKEPEADASTEKKSDFVGGVADALGATIKAEDVDPPSSEQPAADDTIETTEVKL